MRARRRALPDVVRFEAALAVASLVRRTTAYRKARNLAGYLPVGGELDPTPLMEIAAHEGKCVFVPVVGASGKMRFARLWPGMPMVENRFGIPEPAPGSRRLLPPRRLDVVLTPLLAFDAAGHRLGMGGGYYDRCFSFLRIAHNWTRPALIGVAYDLQRVDALQPNAWDVRLRAIATETGLYRPKERQP